MKISHLVTFGIFLGVSCSAFRVDVVPNEVGRQEDVDEGPTPIPPGQTAETHSGVGTLVASILGGVAQPINAILRRPQETKPQQQTAAVAQTQQAQVQPAAVPVQQVQQVQPAQNQVAVDPIIQAVNAFVQSTTQKVEEGGDDDDEGESRYRFL